MQQNQPLVSIITISFNSGRYIEETIKSVLSQDYPNIEYSVIDGGSTDDTLEIIRRYEKRLKCISAPDHGISDAMNKGIRLSKGEIIAHLHSNDKYRPEVISRVVRFFKDNPDKKWLYGDINFVDEEGRIRKRLIFPKRYNYDYRLLKKVNIIPHPAVFVKREVFNEVGLFDLKYKYAMDYDMWLRIGARYEPLQIYDVLVNFRETGISSVEAINALKEGYEIRNNIDSSILFKAMNYAGYLRKRYAFPFIKLKRKMQYFMTKNQCA